MTVLEIMQRACYQMGIPAPSTLIGLTDTTDLQLLALFYQVHDWLRNQRIWVQSKRTHVFTLEEDVRTYQLPQDYFAAILGTQWDDTTKFPLIGPLSDSQYDARFYGLIGFSPFPAYRIFGPDINPYSDGGQFEVWPIPGADGDTISFEYQTKSTFIPKNWTPSLVVTSGEYLNSNGNNYRCTTGGTTSATNPLSGQDTSPFANGTAQFVYSPEPYDLVLQNTDMSMYDPNLVIAGFRKWYRDAFRQDSSQDEKEFRELIDSAKNRYYGTYRGSMSRYRRRRWVGISPQGGWDLS
jgi:hypothetical protein